MFRLILSQLLEADAAVVACSPTRCRTCGCWESLDAMALLSWETIALTAFWCGGVFETFRKSLASLRCASHRDRRGLIGLRT